MSGYVSVLTVQLINKILCIQAFMDKKGAVSMLKENKRVK